MCPPNLIAEAWTLDRYDSGLGRAITRCKGAPDRAVGVRLARLLAQRLTCAASTAVHLQTATAVSWIPSPWTRRIRRGFALSALLSREISNVSNLPCRSLLEVAPGMRQATAGRHARSRNLRGRIRARPRGIHGPVLLVDDVVTTGATATRCAEELLGSGADRVVLITLCQAGNAEDREPHHDVRLL